MDRNSNILPSSQAVGEVQEFPPLIVVPGTLYDNAIVYGLYPNGVLVPEHGRFILSSNEGHHIYCLGDAICETICGRVYIGIEIVQNLLNGQQIFVKTTNLVAIKIIYKNRIGAIPHEDPLREIRCMQYIEQHGGHPNIVRFIACLQNANYYFNIMEYLPGHELLRFIQNHGPLQENETKHIMKQMLSGVSFLKRIGLGHRDVSCENFIISPRMNNDNGELQYHITYIDFGLCLLLPRLPNNDICLIPPQGRVGKPNCISPEVVLNEAPFNAHVADVWALGVILYILLFGHPPFPAPLLRHVRYRIIVIHRQLDDLLSRQGSVISDESRPLIVQLILGILVENPNLRLTVEQIIQHVWLS